MPKFDMAEHEKRMRLLIKPQGVVSPLADRISRAAQKRRLPKSPSGGITSGV